MALAIPVSIELWEKALPRSKMIRPSEPVDLLKYGFWRMYTPLHPTVRDLGLAAGVVRHSGRQRFLIGKIAPGHSLASVVAFLISQGYGNHFIAWKDDGELVSLRKVINFKEQYHLRIFSDGEIRGHFEYTPECYPILHFKAVNQQNCSDEFLDLLKGMIIPAKKS